jgi:hypothetical protein
VTDPAVELRPVFDAWGRYVGATGELPNPPLCEGCYAGDDATLGSVSCRVDRSFWHERCWQDANDRASVSNCDPPRNWSQCTACGAPVYLAYSMGGSRMMIDRDPVPDGRIAFVNSRIAKYLTSAEQDRIPESVRRYASHFSTCPARRDVQRMREMDKRR